jgi:hypothetical protein
MLPTSKAPPTVAALEVIRLRMLASPAKYRFEYFIDADPRDIPDGVNVPMEELNTV